MTSSLSVHPSGMPAMKAILRATRLAGGLLLVACGTLFGATPQPPRLALVTEAPELAAAADLLTAKFTAAGTVSLVERADINRILKEQALSASNQGDLIKLGRLLNAQGLLLLGTGRQDTNRWVHARLVAVEPGVVLAVKQYPFPLQDLPQWSALVPKQLAPFLPKLSVLTKDAVPISILNLRSAVSTPESQALERELTLLLTHRLTHERELFVLERTRMEKLAQEKALAEGEAGGFWSGAYLLDGTINKEGMAGDRVTVNGRLMAPRGGGSVAVEVAGTRGQLPKVVEELTAKILLAIRRTSRPASWNPLEEASQYLEEARWALKWNMLKEAQTASESSWALGVRSTELATIRVRAYGEDTRLGVNVWTITTTGQLVNEKPPDMRKLQPSLRALETYLEHTGRHAKDGLLDTAWYTLGVDQLTLASQLLKQVYHAVTVRYTAQDQLGELRARARELAGLLTEVPELRKDSSASGLPTVMLSFAPYWQETPEQVLALQRTFLEGGYRWRMSPTPGLTGPVLSDLIAWNRADEGRVAGLKRDFVNQLCKSTNVMLRVEGLITRAKASVCGYEFEDHLPALLDTLWEHREQLFAGGFMPPVWAEVRQMLQNPAPAASQELGARLSEETLTPFLQRMDAAAREITRRGREKEYRDEAAARRAEQRKTEQPRRDALRQQLQTATTIDQRAFFFQFATLNFTPEEAKELLPLVKAYQQRLGRQSNDVTWLEHKLKVQGKLWPPASSTPTNPPVVVGSLSGSAPTSGVPGSGDKAVPVTINAVIVDRFWPIPLKSTPERPVEQTSLAGLELKNGRLWLQVNYQDRSPNYNYRSRMAVYSLDPVTARSEMIEIPTAMPLNEPDLHKRALQEGAPRFFAVHGDYLFAPVDGRSKKYSLRSRVWQDMKMNWPPDARFFSVQDRLYLTSRDSIMEMNPDTEEVKVLASSRRRPPETIVDQLPELGTPPVFAGPRGSLRALVGNRVYGFDPVARTWAEVAPIPGTVAFPLSWDWLLEVQDDVLLAHHGPQGDNRRTFALYRDAAAFQTLFVSKPPPHFAGPSSRPASEPALWDAPVGLVPNQMAARTEANRLWLLSEFATIQTGVPRSQTPGRDGISTTATLVCFLDGTRTPLLIPLVLKIPGRTLDDYTALQFLNELSRRPSLHIGPQTLVIHRGSLPGVWLLPKAVLEPRLAVHRKFPQAQEQDFVNRIEVTKASQLRPSDRDRNGARRMDPLEEVRRSTQTNQIAASPSVEELKSKWAPLPRAQVLSAAQDGDAGAQCYEAFLQAEGTAGRPNLGEALKWYRKAAAQGLTTAQLQLAGLLAKPPHSNEKRAEARRWLEKAARAGDVEAQIRLGRFILRPWGSGKVETANAVYWFKKVLAAGRTEAYADIAWAYLSTTDIADVERQKEALQWFRKGIGLNDSPSRVGLGECLLKGYGGQRDPAEGRRLIQSAAEANSAVGQRAFGMILEGELNAWQEGATTKPDYEQAAAWYRKAAEQKDSEAMLRLALLHYHRRITGSPVEAVPWLQRAWDAGRTEALPPLADLYEKGVAQPRHSGEEPLAIHELLIQAGHAETAIKVAQACRYGQGTARSPLRAALYYVYALYAGNAEAKTVFAMLNPQFQPHPQRTAADRELAEGLSLICRGLLLEDVSARLQVANQAMTPKTGSPNLRHAWVWFRLAAGNGDARAKVQADEVYQKLDDAERLAAGVEAQRLEAARNRLQRLRQK